MELVSPGGRVHIVGMATPTVELQAQTAVSREITMTASYAYTRAEFEEVAESALRLEPSMLLMQPVTCSLEDAAEHVEALLSQDYHVGKVVICP